jgi:hypothetical protein
MRCAATSKSLRRRRPSKFVRQLEKGVRQLDDPLAHRKSLEPRFRDRLLAVDRAGQLTVDRARRVRVNDKGRGGIKRTSSSAVEERMFVSFFSLVALTSRSSAGPSISRVTTPGFPTRSSKPSLRMISTSTASSSSPMRSPLGRRWGA